MAKRILFICIFNLQRSVVGEYLFRDLVNRERPENAKKIETFSAGFMGAEVLKFFEERGIDLPKPLFGRIPSDVAQASLLKRGIDISSHRSRLVDHNIIEQANMIVPFLEVLKGDLIAQYPVSKSKIILPRELIGQEKEFQWEDPTAVPLDHRMYRFAHFNKNYVNSQIDEVEQFLQQAFPEILRRLFRDEQGPAA